MSEWFLLQNGPVLYAVLFLMLLGGAVGLPIPEDLPLILGGVVVHTGQAQLELVLAISYLGVVLGDLIIFFVGRYFGPSLFQKSWFKRRFTPSKVRKVRFNLERRSLLMILIARHLFYLRTATFLTCGAVRMSPYRFIVADMFAALISIPLMVGLGYLAAQHIDTLLEGVTRTKNIVLILSILLLLVYLWHSRRKKRQAEERVQEGENELRQKSEESEG
jgi:membrane protein DedA with SNARE-associated domain